MKQRGDKYRLPPELVGKPRETIVKHRHYHAHDGFAAGPTSPDHPTDHSMHHGQHPQSIEEWDNSHFHGHAMGGAYPENVELLD